MDLLRCDSENTPARGFASLSSDTDAVCTDTTERTLGSIYVGQPPADPGWTQRRPRCTNADKMTHATSRECADAFTLQAKRCGSDSFCESRAFSVLQSTEMWNFVSIVQTLAHGRVEERHVASRQRLFTEFMYAGNSRFEICALKLDEFVRQHIGKQGESAFSAGILNSTITSATCTGGKVSFCRYVCWKQSL